MCTYRGDKEVEDLSHLGLIFLLEGISFPGFMDAGTEATQTTAPLSKSMKPRRRRAEAKAKARANVSPANDPVDEDDFLDEDAVRALLDDKVSTSAIRKIMRKQKIFGCMSCPCCCPSFKALLQHLNTEKHFFGVKKLNKYKMAFVDRINLSRTRVEDWKPIEDFSETHELYETMEPHEKAEYIKLVWLTLLQKRINKSNRGVETEPNL
jgi:hypothetical protein